MSKIEELLRKVGADFDIENKRIKATVSHNGSNIINIRIEVLEDETAKVEAKKFEEYVNTLPDELFMATLDFIGQDEVKRISDCIYSENLESVRSGILKFKKALKQVINSKLAELQTILPSCK